MPIRTSRRGLFALAATSLLLAGGAAAQESWPQQPIKILIPAGPGGVPDLAARILAPEMQKVLGQPVVIENKPGAAGQVAAELLARSKPDGYTLFMTTGGSQAIAPSLFPNLPYDPFVDHMPVSFIARVPHVLLVPPSLNVKTAQELIALLKKEPGKHNFASSGIGAPPHLAGELFRLQSGTDVVHVAYTGSAPALTDLIAGRVTYLVDALPPAIGHIKSGKLVAIGVGTKERTPSMPDLPTLAEQGLPSFESYTWAGLFAPAKTPPEVIAKINDAVKKAAATDEVKKKMAELAYDLVASTPEELLVIQKSERDKWADVIKRAGIKAPN